MLTINLVFILRKSDNYSVNLFSNRNMNSDSQQWLNTDIYLYLQLTTAEQVADC